MIAFDSELLKVHQFDAQSTLICVGRYPATGSAEKDKRQQEAILAIAKGINHPNFNVIAIPEGVDLRFHEFVGSRTLKVVNAMASYRGTANKYEELECAFCGNWKCVSDDYHTSDCPVLLAQKIIADLSNEPQE